MILIAVFILIVIGLTYWELWVCEGTHLGKVFVTWTYDLAANRYERIKSYDWDWEKRFLGEPLARTLGALTHPIVLDIGAGTGRLARGLELGIASDPIQNELHEGHQPSLDSNQRLSPPVFQNEDSDRESAQDQYGFPGLLVCLEPSKRMLALGRQKTPDWAQWLRAWSVPLPFPNSSFDVIACLEVLEFTPEPLNTLEEIERTLRPRGWLLLSNRRGVEAQLILGKTFSKEELRSVLTDLGFHDVRIYPWQVDYDLIWARKNWVSAKR